MLHKRHLISVAIGAIFLLTLGATSVSAADAAKDDGHQHQSGQAAGHGEKKSDNHHGHQCHDKMSAVDLNKDGKISKEEFMKHHEAMFDKKDANKDGFVDESEMHKMMDHMHKHDQKKEDAHAH
ncbi:MAG: EF-hand domain-containing protein [Nitrosomonas sp.]|nr:EF-hand domain-containing protein [Nitrosomonas sp.]MBP7112113.1 EF-hand domain-containing protein [Nitrosomonas sp.]